jgi:hypothetical protein
MVRWSALVSGVTGLIADLFLVLFYLFYFGFGTGAFLGTVNDVLIVVQYVALVPVVLALGRPASGTDSPSRSTKARRWTLLGLVAAVAVIVLQVALLAGLPFEIQVVPVSLSSIAAMCWAGGISRTGGLPAAVARLGRLLLVALPIAIAAFAVGFAVTLVSGVSWAWIAGALPGIVLWFLFPVWTVRLSTSGALSGTPQPVHERREPRFRAVRVPPR